MLTIKDGTWFDSVMLTLARACDANPLLAIGVIMMFYIMFNIVLSIVEKLVFGKGFEHWLDVVIGCAFILLSYQAVKYCAILKDYLEGR